MYDQILGEKLWSNLRDISFFTGSGEGGGGGGRNCNFAVCESQSFLFLLQCWKKISPSHPPQKKIRNKFYNRQGLFLFWIWIEGCTTHSYSVWKVSWNRTGIENKIFQKTERLSELPNWERRTRFDIYLFSKSEGIKMWLPAPFIAAKECDLP